MKATEYTQAAYAIAMTAWAGYISIRSWIIGSHPVFVIGFAILAWLGIIMTAVTIKEIKEDKDDNKY